MRLTTHHSLLVEQRVLKRIVIHLVMMTILNLNGLIRQYIPKSTDFSSINDEQIMEIQNKLNRRPRNRFNYENPIF